MKTLPRTPFEVIEAKLFFLLLMGLLANPSRLDGGGQYAQICRREQVSKIVFLLPEARCSPMSHASSPGRCC